MYVFRKTEHSWTQEAYLKPHAPLGPYRFGSVVDLDGDTLAVGAPGDDGMGAPGATQPIADSGAIYVFERSTGTWAETAQLRAANPGPSDELGMAVVLRYDLIVAGAWGEDSSPEFLGMDEIVEDAGAIYVFARQGDTFAPLGVSIAKPEGVQRFAAFGSAVTLCDPRTMFVGAQATDLNAKGAGSTGYLMSTEPPFEVLTIVESRDPEVEARFAGAADCQPDALFVGAWNEDDQGAAYLIR